MEQSRSGTKNTHTIIGSSYITYTCISLLLSQRTEQRGVTIARFAIFVQAEAMSTQTGALQRVRIPAAEVLTTAIDDVALVDGCKLRHTQVLNINFVVEYFCEERKAG